METRLFSKGTVRYPDNQRSTFSMPSCAIRTFTPLSAAIFRSLALSFLSSDATISQPQWVMIISGTCSLLHQVSWVRKGQFHRPFSSIF